MLTTPPDVLERIFDRLRADVAARQRNEADTLEEARFRDERNLLVAEACEMVPAGLPAA